MTRATLVAALILGFGGAVALGVLLFDNDLTPTPPNAVETHLVYDIERDPDVPDLPFDDNPDPSQCGIPVQWGDGGRAWLSGVWEGELIQPEVLLYDSHLRTSVSWSAPHGTEVEIVLFQENPVLDYYFVRVLGDVAQAGWVPEPFLSFHPVA
ncbi:MAG: hypothetical protein WAL25_09715 [Acidimicrobiia bacterium]